MRSDERARPSSRMARAAGRVTAWATRSEPPNVFLAFGQHGRLFRAWLPFASWLLFRTDLAREDVELLVLRSAWNCASPYEWTQHVALAERAGLDHDLIVHIGDTALPENRTARQRLLLQAADELHADHVVTDATRSALLQQLTTEELIEVCFVVGHYGMVAMTLNTLEVETELSARRRLGPRALELADRLQRDLRARRAK